MRPVTLITGASAGIGAALAHVFAAHGHELVLIARRAQRLDELAKAIAAKGRQTTIVLPIDLALTDLSLAFVGILELRRGGILDVASVAGFLPGPGMAVYHATKAYVLSFSEALHCELAARGVRVTALCPGPVATEFQERAGLPGDSYPSLLTESAEDLAKQGYRALKEGQRVVVPGFGNKAVTTLARLVPRGVLLAALQRRNRRRSR